MFSYTLWDDVANAIIYFCLAYELDFDNQIETSVLCSESSSGLLQAFKLQRHWKFQDSHYLLSIFSENMNILESSPNNASNIKWTYLNKSTSIPLWNRQITWRFPFSGVFTADKI